MNWEEESGHLDQQANKNEENPNAIDEVRSIRPVTIKQILSAVETNNTFSIENYEIHQVSVIARVIRTEIQETNATYYVGDGTATIQASVYLDGPKENWTEGTYVKIIGMIQNYQGTRILFCFRIKKITDFNEITYHHLQAINVYLYYSLGPLPEDEAQVNSVPIQPQTPNKFNAGTQNNFNNNNFNNQYNQQQQQDGNFSPLQVQILQTIQSSANPLGLTAREVCAMLASEANAQMIEQELNFLQEENHIFTSSPQNHFKLVNPNQNLF